MFLIRLLQIVNYVEKSTSMRETRFEYKIFPDKNLLVESFIGNHNIKNIIDAIELKSGDPYFPEINRILTSFRQAEISMNIKEMEELTDMLRHSQLSSALRWSVLTDSPYTTALSIIARNEPVFENVINTFSTLNAAMRFLMLPPNDMDVIRTLNDFES